MAGIHHVFISVNDIARSRAFYAALLPRLSYGACWEFAGADRAQVDALAREVPGCGGAILDPPRAYSEYAPGYCAVFFRDPDGIKLEAVHLPGVAA